MYSQEDVETPEEMDGFSGHDAIQARVKQTFRILCRLVRPFIQKLLKITPLWRCSV